MQSLVTDKLRYFPDFLFFIQNYDFYKVNGDCRLSVVTTLDADLLEKSADLAKLKKFG